MEEEGCKYDWCLTIPQIHMAQFFIQYYISVVAFPFCTTLIAAVFSCVLGDIPQVLLINSFTPFILIFHNFMIQEFECLIPNNSNYQGILAGNAWNVWKFIARCWAYCSVLHL